MAAAVDTFGSWLIDKLRALNIDESVFGAYISGILDGDESSEEKKEALEGVLSDMLENDITQHVTEIIEKWTNCQPSPEDNPVPSSADVEDRLVKLLGSQTLATAAPRHYTDEEKKIRQAVLQYSQLSDGEDAASSGGEGDGDLVRNTNAATVAAAARERREQAKQDSQKKKEKDKEDREKQKQLKEEKKEKRKTVKNERKR